ARKPVWYVMPGGCWNAAGDVFSGPLYQPLGSPYMDYDAHQFQARPAAGEATISYQSNANAILSYVIDGNAGTKTLEPQNFGVVDNKPKLAVGDLWWGGEDENGWGVNIVQQGSSLFVTWYTYDSEGQVSWYVMPAGTWDGTIYAGTLYRTRGSPWVGHVYDASLLQVVPVGTLSLNFIDQGLATMTYPLASATQTKVIVRQPF
ncbi:MAG: hypothetical protein ABI905_17340, partial [Betaproteobacteria bacterium]